MTILRLLFAAALTATIGITANAQGTSVPFSGLEHDSDLPVEVSSDSLSVNSEDGTAEFVGSVIASQGTLKLGADRLLIDYADTGEDGSGQISVMQAFGNVTLTNGGEAAEAQTAVYDVDAGIVTLTGDALLTQGQNAISGEKVLIDLNSGEANFEGRVRTIFQPSSN